MEELLIACRKFISQISPSGEERYYDIDPQDLKEFCDAVEAAQQAGAVDGGDAEEFEEVLAQLDPHVSEYIRETRRN